MSRLPTTVIIPDLGADVKRCQHMAQPAAGFQRTAPKNGQYACLSPNMRETSHPLYEGHALIPFRPPPLSAAGNSVLLRSAPRGVALTTNGNIEPLNERRASGLDVMSDARARTPGRQASR